MEGQIDRDEALGALRNVERLSKRTQDRLSSFWRPAALWGLLLLGSIPLAALPGPTWSFKTWEALNRALGYYLMAALAVGLFGTVALHRNRELRAKPKPSSAALIVALAILLLTPFGGFVLGGVFLSSAVGTGWYLAIAAVTLATGWAARNKPLTVVSIPLLLLAGASMFFASHAPIVLSTVFSAAYLGTAAFERHARERASA